MNVGAVARSVRARAGLWLAELAEVGTCLASVRALVAATPGGRSRQLLAMWSAARAWLQAQLQTSAGGRQLARVVQMSAGGGWLGDVSDASRNRQASKRLRAGELQGVQRSSRPRGVSFRGKRLRRNAGQSQTSDLDLA
jgi:hypothetical protein